MAAIQEAEAVANLLDGLEWPGIAVGDDHIAEELGIPDRRELAGRDEITDDAVEELARVGVEQRAIGVE